MSEPLGVLVIEHRKIEASLESLLDEQTSLLAERDRLSIRLDKIGERMDVLAEKLVEYEAAMRRLGDECSG